MSAIIFNQLYIQCVCVRLCVHVCISFFNDICDQQTHSCTIYSPSNLQLSTLLLQKWRMRLISWINNICISNIIVRRTTTKNSCSFYQTQHVAFGIDNQCMFQTKWKVFHFLLVFNLLMRCSKSIVVRILFIFDWNEFVEMIISYMMWACVFVFRMLIGLFI